MESMISVIVPVYNTPLLKLRRCIESIVNQSYENLEIIIVDDGSDTIVDYLVNEYKEKDNRIVYIKKENGGVASARNLGMNSSNGVFLSFVDSDDYLEENFYSEMSKMMYDSDLAICSIEEQYFPTKKIWTDIKTFSMMPTDYAWIQYINFCHNKLFLSSIIKNNGILFDETVRLGEDALFISDYLDKIHSIRITDKRLYHYVPNHNSLVNSFDIEFYKYEIKVIEKQYGFFNNFILSKRQEMFLYRWLYEKFKYLVYYYVKNMKNGDKKEINRILKYVSQHDLYNRLLNSKYKNNISLNRNDKTILKIWKVCGTTGYKLTRNISTLIKKGN